MIAAERPEDGRGRSDRAAGMVNGPTHAGARPDLAGDVLVADEKLAVRGDPDVAVRVDADITSDGVRIGAGSKVLPIIEVDGRFRAIADEEVAPARVSPVEGAAEILERRSARSREVDRICPCAAGLERDLPDRGACVVIVHIGIDRIEAFVIAS